MLAGAALFAAVCAVLWALVHFVLPQAWSAVQSLSSRAARALLRRQRMAAWYERGALRLRPLHPYRSLAVAGALGLAAAAATGAVFFALAERVTEESVALQRLDHGAWEWARSVRSPGANTLFVAFTLLGTPIGWAVIVLPAVVALAVRRRTALSLYLVGATLGAWAVNHGLKALFARARPDLSLAVLPAHGFSFPSGHAMMSVVAAGALAYVVMRLPTSWRQRSAAIAVASAVAAAIAASRVYLGVHWLSDIVAGGAAGLVWLAAVTAVYEVFRRLRAIRRGAGLG
jgi:undecaprenyl-diphosphatase